MTDSELIKALENKVQGSDYACFEDYEILDLIKRQKGEIERLNIRNKALTAIIKNYDWKFARAKSEAIKEFADRLKEHKILLKDGHYLVDAICIDNLVKEMTEENGK